MRITSSPQPPAPAGPRPFGAPELILACLVMVTLLLWLTPTLDSPLSEQWAGRDSAKYFRMALDGPRLGLSAVQAPFSYRILVPWTVNLLGLDPALMFRFASGAAAVATLALLSLLFWRWNNPPLHILTAAALLMLTGPWRDAINNHYVTDLPMLAFGAGLLWLAEKRNWPGFALVLAVACLNRESSLGFLLMPAGLLLAEKRPLGQTARRLAAIALPAVGTLVAVRLLIVPLTPLSVWTALKSAGVLSLNYLAGITLRSLGLLFVLAAALPLRQIGRIALQRPHLAAFAVVGLLQTLLGSDTSRLFACSAPFFMYLSIESLKRWQPQRLLLVALVIAQYLFFVTDIREPWIAAHIPAFGAVKAALYGLTLAGAVILMVAGNWRDFGRRPQSRPDGDGPIA